MQKTAESCHHCGLPIPDGIDIPDRYKEKTVRFCCHGCHGAFLIISGSGLDNYYLKRLWTEPGTPEGVYDSSFDDTTLAPYVSCISDSEAEITFLVDGIRCASCVWLLERIINDMEGVIDIRVNYGSHRARIRFEPEQIGAGALFSAVSRLGYFPRPYTRNAIQEMAAREQKSLLIRFGTAGFLSMQLMGYSLALYAGYFQGIDPGIRQLIQYFAAAVTTPVVLYSGWPFLSGAWRSVANRAPNMDLLIALGVCTAYIYSLFSMFTGGEVYFDTAAMIITLILLGRLLESSARNRSMSGINRLLQLAPEKARRIEQGEATTVPSIELVPGDMISLLPGERLPVDAVITDGDSEFDESAISGESLPVYRGPGTTVVSGSLNLSNALTLKVERIMADSFISRMNRLVEEAQNRKAPVQSLADRVASIFVPLVISIALATWIYWYLSGGSQVTAMLNAVAVLIVACPCALGLATPTAVLVATGQAASAGILFRGGDILETTSRARLIAFDKTGTLTRGTPQIAAICPAARISEEQLLVNAVTVASGSNHPLSVAICEEAARKGIPIPSAINVQTVAGRGLRFEREGETLLLGSRLFLEEQGIMVPDGSHRDSEALLAKSGQYRGAFRFSDPLRAEAASAIAELHDQGIKTALLTGDRLQPAEQIARQAAISEIHAELRPEQKADWVKERQAEGNTVIMVGDGINDAPALSQADVGCAMAGGTDIALETSDLVLTRPDLKRLLQALFIARKGLSTIRQNLFWAFSYNLVAIPLAASGLLAPVWAAAAMALSSILVIGNSLILGRRLKKRVAISNPHN